MIFLGSRLDEVIPISSMAERIHVPAHYLEILLQLKAKGFVKSKRGMHGGYQLRMKPDEIVIGQVIRDMEGPLAPMS
ncbi:hypothetical protein GCM10011571_31380 [Marinithermofilum abyssi]|uniref:Rrf2 family transcriptional regulator n=1 Tax=Marinithermofilum abyssi TaxID=1571185 RepID=A0A8J2VI44_9BACL|nr:Rrf2 family transcriptional regulator [Marinithermofilum abyssi]GGE26904.1 hypothetical protein GCM10011571_31380 [Marinithermofilum abyssi]